MYGSVSSISVKMCDARFCNDSTERCYDIVWSTIMDCHLLMSLHMVNVVTKRWLHCISLRKKHSWVKLITFIFGKICCLFSVLLRCVWVRKFGALFVHPLCQALALGRGQPPSPRLQSWRWHHAICTELVIFAGDTLSLSYQHRTRNALTFERWLITWENACLWRPSCFESYQLGQ